MSEIKYVDRQIWRQEPDCYSGKNLDQLRPRWMTSYPKHGDEEDGEVLEFKIDARMMPPGSRITIEVPVCPQCGDPADMNEPKKRVRRWPCCECGFSWAKWAEGQYGASV